MHPDLERKLHELRLGPDGLPADVRSFAEFLARVDADYQESAQTQSAFEESVLELARDAQMRQQVLSRRHELDVKNERDKLKDILDSLGHGVMEFDRQGRLVYANQDCRRLLECSAD